MGTINKNKTKLQMRTSALVMTAACAYALDANGAEQFAEGFMQGVFGSVEGAVKCIRDIKRLGSEVETTITDLKGHSYIKAIREVGTNSHELSSDLADCESGEGDASALIQQLEDIYSGSSWWNITWEVGKNVLTNGVDIYHDIEGTISSYDSGDYETMGLDIGNGVKLAALGTSVGEFSEAVAEKFVTGFLEGAIGGVDFPLRCLRDVKRLVKEVKTTVSDFEGHKYVSGIKEVATIAGELGSDLQDCEGAEQEGKDAADALIKLFHEESGWKVAFTVGKNVLVNGVDVYHDITGAISDYDSSNWENYGKDIGDILKLAAGGSNGFDGDCSVPTGVEFGQACRMRELCGTGCAEGKCVWTWPSGSTMDDPDTKCGCQECSATFLQ